MLGWDMRLWVGLLPLLLVGCSTPVGAFECGGKALQTGSRGAVCDGVVDCWGGQDEAVADCATDLFYCTESVESEAILGDRVCDGVKDCAGTVETAAGPLPSSDEAGCP